MFTLLSFLRVALSAHSDQLPLFVSLVGEFFSEVYENGIFGENDLGYK